MRHQVSFLDKRRIVPKYKKAWSLNEKQQWSEPNKMCFWEGGLRWWSLHITNTTSKDKFKRQTTYPNRLFTAATWNKQRWCCDKISWFIDDNVACNVPEGYNYVLSCVTWLSLRVNVRTRLENISFPLKFGFRIRLRDGLGWTVELYYLCADIFLIWMIKKYYFS